MTNTIRAVDGSCLLNADQFNYTKNEAGQPVLNSTGGGAGSGNKYEFVAVNISGVQKIYRVNGTDVELTVFFNTMWEDIEENGLDAVWPNVTLDGWKVSCMYVRHNEGTTNEIHIYGLTWGMADYRNDLEEYNIKLTKTIATGNVEDDITCKGFVGTTVNI